MRREWLIVAAFFGVLVSAVYFLWWRPNSRKFDQEWWDSATICERLQNARQVLALPYSSYHDPAFMVLEYRDYTAVPYLIQSLRWQGDSTECTKHHCLEALRVLTGVNAGDTHAEWQRWWRAHRHEKRWYTPRPGC